MSGLTYRDSACVERAVRGATSRSRWGSSLALVVVLAGSTACGAPFGGDDGSVQPGCGEGNAFLDLGTQHLVDAGIPRDKIECLPAKGSDGGPALLAKDLGASCDPFIQAVTAALPMVDAGATGAMRVLVACESTADLWIYAEPFPNDPAEGDSITVYRLR